jgi:signal transduction histidine kinase
MQNFVITHPLYQDLAFYNVIGERTIGIEATPTGTVIQKSGTSDSFKSFVADVLNAPIQTTHLIVNSEADRTTDKITFALRSPDGVIMISLWSEWVFQPGAEKSISETWSLRLPIQVILHFTPPGQDILSPAINKYDDWLRNSRGYYIDGDNHVFYQNISIPTSQDRYTVTLFHTVPTQRLSADLSLYYKTFASLAVGVLLCVIALALFSIGRFVEPLRQLKQSVDDIRKTHRTPALPKQLPPDEIGELSLAFYTMAIELEAKRQSERALVEKLITAQEEERARIAYDLHDGLIQQLVGARFYLNQCKIIFSDVITNPSLEIFTQGYDSLSSAIVEGRRIMQGLHPSILDDLGLIEALGELSHMSAKRGHWHNDIDLEKLDIEPDKAVSVTLYRIVQEALNNIIQHAKATHITLKLWQDNGIYLVGRDDGQGFNPEQPPESDSGWGLRTMKERVNLLYGTIEITSQLGEGTTITIWIPEEQTNHTGVTHDSNSK